MTMDYEWQEDVSAKGKHVEVLWWGGYDRTILCPNGSGSFMNLCMCPNS